MQDIPLCDLCHSLLKLTPVDGYIVECFPVLQSQPVVNNLVHMSVHICEVYLWDTFPEVGLLGP